MLKIISHALSLALLAAVAVDFGFGVAFVDDRVAYLVTAYVCVLFAILVGRSGSRHWSRKVAWRLPMALLIASVVVLSLRGWALFELPFGEFVTTGHSPYVVFGVCALLSGGLYGALRARFEPSAGTPPPRARRRGDGAALSGGDGGRGEDSPPRAARHDPAMDVVDASGEATVPKAVVGHEPAE